MFNYPWLSPAEQRRHPLEDRAAGEGLQHVPYYSRGFVHIGLELYVLDAHYQRCIALPQALDLRAGFERLEALILVGRDAYHLQNLQELGRDHCEAHVEDALNE